jgi:hypothetical protein
LFRGLVRVFLLLCSTGLLLTLSGGLAGCAGCADPAQGDDDIIVDPLEPAIVTSIDGTTPGSTVDFGEVNVRTYLTREFYIRNGGQATLHLKSVALKTGGDASSGTNYYEITQAPAMEIPAGGQTSVRVKFWAYQYDSAGTTDVVVISSDDEKSPEVQVGVQAVVVKPKLSVAPSALNFNQVTTGETVSQSLAIQNIGDGKLTVLELNFSEGMNEFAVALPSSFKLGDSLAAGIGINVTITYAPKDGNTDQGTLTIVTNDVDNQRVEVPITGNGEEDLPPVVDITSPGEGDSFYTGSTVLLSARVSDAGDRPEDLQLFWTSSIDGQLCPNVKADASGVVTCSAPVHKAGDEKSEQVITLVALDSAKQTGTDSVTIKVWDQKTPLNYVISGSDTTSLYAFTPDDNMQIWVVDGETGEQASSPCVYDMDDSLAAEPPRSCNAKYGDYLRIMLYDRYGPGATLPRLYLWYGQNDEWKQPLVEEAWGVGRGDGSDYYYSVECQPVPRYDEWLATDPEPGTHPDDCLTYDNGDPDLDPFTNGLMIKITIPPPEPTE